MLGSETKAKSGMKGSTIGALGVESLLSLWQTMQLSQWKKILYACQPSASPKQQ